METWTKMKKKKKIKNLKNCKDSEPEMYRSILVNEKKKKSRLWVFEFLNITVSLFYNNWTQQDRRETLAGKINSKKYKSKKDKSLLRGIEPRSRAWQARILTVKLQEIEIASNRIRTYDLLITSEVPYQLGHRSCFLLVWAPMPWPVLMLCKLPVALYVWCRWYLMDMGVTPTWMVY